ncbi:MAG: MBL fold metallo-hydrolase [Bacteroidales bacterium]|nr:MBL fold metallo-hydrolase [Bacteroidales bacterium]
MTKIKFRSLSSGSCGNCYYLALEEDDGSRIPVLIDAGVSPRRLKKEMGQEAFGDNAVRGILVTHDHMDHIRSLGSYCKHLRWPVWTTPCLHRALSRHTMTSEYIAPYRKELSEGWNDIVPGRIRARCFEVPHDATQTVGYAIMLDDFKFVIMTDIGRMTEEAMNFAVQADTVVIESNYDIRMLAEGPYPKELQDRIRGGNGHLSNVECAAAIRGFLHEGLRYVFLCHLSEHNNTPELALKESAPVLEGSGTRLIALPRENASPLFSLYL